MTDRYHFRPADHHLPAALLRPLQQHLAHQRPCYLWQAERFDWVVGVIAWQREPRSQTTATVALHVDAGCRSQGVGRFLLSQTLILAREHGLQTLLVRVPYEQKAALALFHQFAFAPLLEASAQEPGQASVWLGKSLMSQQRAGLDRTAINKAA